MDDIDGLAQEIYGLILARTTTFGSSAATLIGVLATIIVNQSQGDPKKSKILCEGLSGELLMAVEKGNSEARHPNLN